MGEVRGQTRGADVTPSVPSADPESDWWAPEQGRVQGKIHNMTSVMDSAPVGWTGWGLDRRVGVQRQSGELGYT